MYDDWKWDVSELAQELTRTLATTFELTQELGKDLQPLVQQILSHQREIAEQFAPIFEQVREQHQLLEDSVSRLDEFHLASLPDLTPSAWEIPDLPELIGDDGDDEEPWPTVRPIGFRPPA